MIDQALRERLAHDELLLAPAWVMLPDGPANHHGVVVRQGCFAAVGPIAELTRDWPQLVPTVLPDMLLMPGFIDAHHHLTQ